MGISRERFLEHKEQYSRRFQDYRTHWPTYLYRHEPLQNALSILGRGSLLSRNDAVDASVIMTDIAPSEIIDHRSTAHTSGRLYFRPRTPTQFHIEGIRKPEDYFQGKHAGFLVMLMFDSECVLTQPTVRFSCGNMQSSQSVVRDGDVGFGELDFDGIYHDSAYPSSEVKRNRCAEVLLPSPFSLEGALKYIAVRTDADVLTLKYLLEAKGLSKFSGMVRRSKSGGIFFNRYTAVDFIDTSPGRINFQLKYSSSKGEIETLLTVSDVESTKKRLQVDARLVGQKKYYVELDLPSGRYLLDCSLESCFAHQSIIDLE